MSLEILIVLVLIALNGLLAMSELAIVSVRPSRLRVRADRGESGAAAALTLAEDPGRFLSTVQIGITLVGVLSGAFSGATIGVRLGSALAAWGLPAHVGLPLGVGIVVVAITYLSLIVGELVPKQLALASPEKIATGVAPAMLALSRVARPLVWLLDRSGRLLLRLIGHSGRRDTAVSDEEIRMVIAEAEGAGVIKKAETEMIAGVMRIADRTARGLMTPRHEVEIAEATETRAQIVHRFRSSGRSRLLLRDGAPDDIVGVIEARELLAEPTEDALFDPRRLAKPVPAIHDALSATHVIERLRAAPAQMLLVYDEYGTLEGIVTPMDILGAIIDGFDEGSVDEPKIVEREDGSLLVAGWMPADEFADRTGIRLKEDSGFETVAGLVLERAAALPAVGEHVAIDGWRIEVVDMDGRRIDKLLVSRSGPMH